MDKAREAYLKAHQLDPQQFDVLNSLGNIDAHEGKVCQVWQVSITIQWSTTRLKVDDAKKWYKHALRVHDSVSVRVKIALMLPPVHQSTFPEAHIITLSANRCQPHLRR